MHWFGLTDSYYWFDFKGIEFPKYSKAIINKWNQTNDLRFIDYQFKRIFEDLFEVIRHVENPVPDKIFQEMSSLEKLEDYLQSLQEWIELSWDESDKQFDEVYEVAREWLYGRKLDFGYLIGAPDCFMIRNKNQLYIYWITEYKDEQGTPFWEQPKGVFSCDYHEFMSDLIESFKAFGLDMREQISDLFKNKPENLNIDCEQIIASQIQYEELIIELENKRLFYADVPDWNNVLKQMNEISRNRVE